MLDDAEHLDDASQRVLVHLCGQDEDAPLLVVLTAPPDALAPLEARLPTSFDGRIPLDPLSPAAVTELIGSELSGAEVPAEVASQLASRADGNPFAVLEFLRHLIEAGGLQPFWGTWVLDTELLDRLRLPSDVVHLVLARLEGIDAPARQLLGAGAVQGMRFDVSLLAASAPAAADDVGDAVVAATRGRVIEHVTHDVYAFLHTELRDALAATLDDSAAARLHHRIAEALEARSASDIEDVYALAQHRVAAGANTDPRRTYHACLAAGQAALAHHAPTEAAAFLTSASTAAASASINLDVGFHQTYAIALLLAGDLATALGQLHAALEVEQEPVRRAELFDLVAEVHHSAGDGARAAETVKHGLAELGARLPKRTPLLIASTLGRVVAGLAVAASRRWFGTATGERRRRYLVEATLLDTGAQAAAVVSDIPLCFAFTLRGVFVINRIGSSPARVRLLGALAIFAGYTGASRLGMRLCASAQRDAEHIGHPALVAHSSWMRGITVLVSEWRTDAMTAALREHGRWLELPDYLMAVTSVAQALTGAGYITPAVMWVERARKRLEVDGSPRDALPIECSASVVEAMRGQAATAETTLRAAMDAVPDAAGTQQHPLAVWARLVSLTEQGEIGSAFDEAAAQLDAVPSRHGAALTMRYTLAYGRLQQAHAAKLRSTTRRDVGVASFDVAIAHAREGIKALRRGRKAPQLHAGRLVLRAWLLHLLGRDRAARRTLHRACRAVDETDAPLLSFDLAHVHARILQAGRHEAEAQRHAMTALMLAVEYGWQYRARRIRDEFSIRDHRSSSHSHPSMQTSGPTSAAHPAVHERRRLEALQHVSATAASVLDPDALIRVALDITLRLLSAERVFFFLAQDDPATGQPALLPHRGYDVDGNELRELTGYSSTLVEQVWQTGEALVVTGSEHGAALGSESAVVHGLRSILVAPLQVKGRRLGVVYLDSRVARGIFTEDDAELLTAITQQVAASLETARAAQLEAAVQAANQQRDLAETLRTSMADLNSTLDPHEVLRRLLARVAATLPGDRAALLPNEPGGVAVVIGAGPAAHDIAAQRLELDHDTAFRALMTGRAPVTDTTRSHAAVLPDAVSAALGEPRSWLCVPVAVRDELAGVIVVGSPDADRYTDVEINVAAALGEQGAVAYENANLFSRVQELATTDELTGAATRRHFWELAEHQRLAASRHRRPLAAIMLDIDHFKSVNDTYGHAVGDAVLREVAARLLSVIREVDIVGRYGGEEFAILLPETADASAVAERLRATVAGTEMPTDAAPVHVTISVGVSYLHPPEDLDTLLGRADAALYRSKAAGRNCVTIA